MSELLRRITSKYNGDFYCLICLHSFRAENKHKFHEKVYKSKYICGIVMATKKNKILGLNQDMNSDKMPYSIYTDI